MNLEAALLAKKMRKVVASSRQQAYDDVQNEDEGGQHIKFHMRTLPAGREEEVRSAYATAA